MADVFEAEYVSLHVRVTNKGAFHLYTQTLGYECGPLSACFHLCATSRRARVGRGWKLTVDTP